MAQRACRDLMRALLAEVRARGAAVFRAGKHATAAIAAAVRPGSSRRPLVAKLLTGVAAITPYGACPPKLAQAP